MYYFTYEMKLQLIPYVQKQTMLFLQFFQQHIFSVYKQNNQQNKSQNKVSSQHFSQQLNQKTIKLLKIVNKRFKQLQQFHYQNWTDYRANLILRSINQIKIFYIQNKEILAKHQNANSQSIQSFKVHQDNDQLKNDSKQQQLQEINQEMPQGQNPTVQDYQKISKQRIKQAVKNIKSQLQQMQPNQLSKINKNSKKPTKIKKSKTKVNQQDVNKIVNNIVEKSKLKQKNIIKNLGKKIQKISKIEIDRQSKEKKNKSKQKPTQLSKSKNINIQRQIHKSIQTQQLHNQHKKLQIKQIKQKQSPKINNKIQSLKSIKRMQKLKMLIGQNLSGSLQKLLTRSKQKIQQAQKNISPYRQKPLIKNLKTQQNAYVSKTSNKTIQQDKHKKVKVSKDEYIKYLKNKN